MFSTMMSSDTIKSSLVSLHRTQNSPRLVFNCIPCPVKKLKLKGSAEFVGSSKVPYFLPSLCEILT